MRYWSISIVMLLVLVFMSCAGAGENSDPKSTVKMEKIWKSFDSFWDEIKAAKSPRQLDKVLDKIVEWKMKQATANPSEKESIEGFVYILRDEAMRRHTQLKMQRGKPPREDWLTELESAYARLQKETELLRGAVGISSSNPSLTKSMQASQQFSIDLIAGYIEQIEKEVSEGYLTLSDGQRYLINKAKTAISSK